MLWEFVLHIENQGYAIETGEEGANRGELFDDEDMRVFQGNWIISHSLPLEPSLSFIDIAKGNSFW